MREVSVRSWCTLSMHVLLVQWSVSICCVWMIMFCSWHKDQCQLYMWLQRRASVWSCDVRCEIFLKSALFSFTLKTQITKTCNKPGDFKRTHPGCSRDWRSQDLFWTGMFLHKPRIITLTVKNPLGKSIANKISSFLHHLKIWITFTRESTKNLGYVRSVYRCGHGWKHYLAAGRSSRNPRLMKAMTRKGARKQAERMGLRERSTGTLRRTSGVES